MPLSAGDGQERAAVVSFVVEALPRELYTELMLGLTGEPTECGGEGSEERLG